MKRFLPSWPVDGTTGYEFMNQVSAVLHDPDGERGLTSLWAEIAGNDEDFASVRRAARIEILDRSFPAQFDALVRSVYQLSSSQLATRDWSEHAIRRCLRLLLAQFPVYRRYAAGDEAADARGQDPMAQALQAASPMCRCG